MTSIRPGLPKHIKGTKEPKLPRDFSRGVFIIDLVPDISPEILSGALPHSVSVESDPRLGTVDSEKHRAFVVRFSGDRHRPDNEILSLSNEMFLSKKIAYAYVGESFGESLFNLVKQVYGEAAFLLGNLKSDISTKQLQECIYVENCIFASEQTSTVINDQRTAFIVFVNDVAGWFRCANSLPPSLFCGKKRYCAIETTVDKAAEKLVRIIDDIPCEDKGRHKMGNNRFIIANIPIAMDKKLLIQYLPNAHLDGDSNDYPSLEVLKNETRYAVVVSYVSLVDELELQSLSEMVFEGMRIKHALIKTSPSATVKRMLRYQKNEFGNWLEIPYDGLPASRVESEKFILSKVPGVFPQIICWAETSAWVDYASREECSKARQLFFA